MDSIKSTLQFPQQVAYCLGANNYCWVYFRTGQRSLLAKPLRYIETQLPDFIRVHKTVLINPSYVTSLHQLARKKKAGKVRMDTGEVFPVSQRRWQNVVERLQMPPVMAGEDQDVTSWQNQSAFTQPTDSATPTLSIVLVSDDKAKVQRMEHLLYQERSAYRLEAVQQGAQLVDLLRRSPESDYPALILLDAQTSTAERLLTLQRLKQSSQLSHIPVILFVLPVNHLIIEGYQYQANSVVLLPSRSARYTPYTSFEQLVGRIFHYWLKVVALPGSMKA